MQKEINNRTEKYGEIKLLRAHTSGELARRGVGKTNEPNLLAIETRQTRGGRRPELYRYIG